MRDEKVATPGKMSRIGWQGPDVIILAALGSALIKKVPLCAIKPPSAAICTPYASLGIRRRHLLQTPQQDTTYIGGLSNLLSLGILITICLFYYP